MLSGTVGLQAERRRGGYVAYTYKKVDYARPDTDVQMYVLFLCSWLETQSAGGPLRSGFFLSGCLAGLSQPI